MKKRILVKMLCLCIMLTLMPTRALAANPTGNWTEVVTTKPEGYVVDGSGNVTISSAEGMAWLASVVNSQATPSAISVTLTADIDLSVHDWIPIGNSYGNMFEGTFDGCGHSITGMTVNISGSGASAGLFGNNHGTVKNISVSGSVTTSYGSNFTGGVVGYNYGTVTNCFNRGDVSVNNRGYNRVGGVVGYNEGTVANCSNSGTVTVSDGSPNCAGGVVGNNSGTVVNCSNSGAVKASNGTFNLAAGVVGYNNYGGTVENCYNSGAVSASGDMRSYVGGVVGDNSGGGTVANSSNSGYVSTSGSTLLAVYTGGVVGYNYNSGTVTNCYNCGAVSASGMANYIGGVMGGNNSGTVANCYSSGAVTSSKSTRAGGVMGYNKGTVGNCYWLETSASSDLGFGNKINCDSFTVEQGKGTDKNFKYTIGSNPQETGNLCDALNAWVTAQTLKNEYLGWLNVSGIDYDYPVLRPWTYAVIVNNGSGSDSYEEGVTVTITADAAPEGKQFDQWTTTSSAITFVDKNAATTTFTMPAESVEVTATYKNKSTGSGGSSSYRYFTITAKADEGGSIYPSGDILVRNGRDKNFTIAANKGYVISYVLVDGKSVGEVESYTFKDVSKKHTIKAIFTEQASNKPVIIPVENPFSDISQDDWFVNDIMRVYENKLMLGASDAIFDPVGMITKGMIVTIKIMLIIFK